MAKSKFLLVLLVFALFLPQAEASTEPCWVYGQIVTVPQEATYNNKTYFQFDFDVNASDAYWITEYPTRIVVLAPIELLVDIALHAEATLNMTGTTQVVGYPEGYFLAETINKQEGGDWTDTLKQLWIAVSSIGAILVTLVIQLVAIGGFTLPHWAANLALVAFTAFVFFKFFKKLPLLIAVILFFICVALIGNLFATLML